MARWNLHLELHHVFFVLFQVLVVGCARSGSETFVTSHNHNASREVVEFEDLFRPETGVEFFHGGDPNMFQDRNHTNSAQRIHQLPAPPANGNWRQADQSSRIRLAFGTSLDRYPATVGATFRKNMGGHDGSCQYWKGGRLNFVDPGWNPYLVGVGSALFGDSLQCGQCVLVYNAAKRRAVVSMITDYCPPPCTKNQLDLHTAASAFLAGGSSMNSQPYRGGPENFKELQMWQVECNWGGLALAYYFDTGSNAFHWYLIITWKTVPIVNLQVYKLDRDGKVAYKAKVDGHDRFGRWVVQFHGKGGAGVYKLLLLGKNGKMITDVLYWNGQPHQAVKGRTNFQPTRYEAVPGWPLP